MKYKPWAYQYQEDYHFFLDIDLDMICLTKGEAGGILGTLGVPTFLVQFLRTTIISIGCYAMIHS